MSSSYEYKEGIVKFITTKRYNCIICTGLNINKNGSTDFVHVHLSSYRHIQTLKSYKHYFSDEVNGIKCKQCKKKISIKQFFNHAESHRLQPWYQHTKNTKRYFKNFTLYHNNCFYCYVCKTTCLRYAEINKHVQSQEHLANRRKKFPNWHHSFYNSLLNDKMLFYENNNVFPINENSCWCWVCDANILTSEIIQHSKSHVSDINKQNEKFILNCKSDNKDEATEDVDVDVDVDEQPVKLSKKLKHFIKYIQKLQLPFTCSICDIRLSTIEQVELHCAGPSHNNQLEILNDKLNTLEGFDNLPIGIYYIYDDNNDNNESAVFKCTLCQSKMFTILELLKHINCIEHFKNITKIYQDNLLFKNIDLPFGIFPTTIDDIYYCHLCHYTMKGFNKISSHIEDKEHKHMHNYQINSKQIKNQYISEEHIKIAKDTTEYPPEIKFICCDESYWWCIYCSYVFIPPQNSDITMSMKIWTHVASTNHIRNKKNNSTYVNKVQEESSNIDDNFFMSLPVDDLYDIQIKNDGKSCTICKPCKLHIYGDIYKIIPTWNDHLNTKNHHQKKLLYTQKKYMNQQSN